MFAPVLHLLLLFAFLPVSRSLPQARRGGFPVFAFDLLLTPDF